ncbi:hypothetical protein J6590_028960 [Homalodisca vitripennis]|nr:hypothetical protein J6590_028960 [Homalodisca vitripennis]
MSHFLLEYAAISSRHTLGIHINNPTSTRSMSHAVLDHVATPSGVHINDPTSSIPMSHFLLEHAATSSRHTLGVYNNSLTSTRSIYHVLLEHAATPILMRNFDQNKVKNREQSLRNPLRELGEMKN